MSASRILGATLAVTALVVLAAAWPQTSPEITDYQPARPQDVPWLTREAAAQIFGPEGKLGPLFDGVELGGPAPPQTVRTRIAAFARANDVDIDLEVVADELAAVRFAVTFGGCCGYEGADVLALRLHRPDWEPCCGCESTWINDWATTDDDGVRMRASVRVNRVTVRWERAATLPELLAQADALLGAAAAKIGKAAGDRWTELEPGRRYRLEVPHAFYGFPQLGLASRDDLGVVARVDSGRIVEVSFTLHDDTQVAAALRSQWGRARVAGDTRTWRTADRVVTAELELTRTKITIAADR